MPWNEPVSRFIVKIHISSFQEKAFENFIYDINIISFEWNTGELCGLRTFSLTTKLALKSGYG